MIHFLNDNDYFKKKEKREKKGIEKEGKKKMEVVAAAATATVSRLASDDDILSSSSSSLLSLNGSAILNNDTIVTSASSSDCVSSVTDTLLTEGQSSSNGETAGIAMQSVENVISAPESSTLTITNEKLENIDSVSVAIGAADGKTNEFIKHIDENGELQNASEPIAVEEDDSNIDPPEVQVSYAMRNVPIVKQPKTLIADLHEHQACVFIRV
jgi:hypothetical protein